jgi:predicted metal-dependent peptidase
MRTIQDQLSRISKTLIFSEPFYGIFLIGLQKEFTKSCATAGVGKHGIGMRLVINPDFFGDLSEPHQQGLLKHELLHIAFGHIILADRYPNKKLFNIAADIEINQYISELMLPEGGLTLNSFPGSGIHQHPRAGTKVYYDILNDTCDGEGNSSNESLQEILDQMDGNSPYCHKEWEEITDLPEAEKKLVQKQYEHQMKQTAEEIQKKCGTIPGELAEIIERLFTITPPKFNWKQYLKRFINNASKVYTKKLRRKNNKRYAGNPGLKIKHRNHVLVGVDTSGSVSSEELVEFMHELTHMYKTGNEITIAQFDTQLTDVSPFNPKKNWEIKGRGGTYFQPVVDHYNDPKNKYSAFICLTDGEAPNPENCPKNALWVHSSYSSINEDLPGIKIQLN